MITLDNGRQRPQTHLSLTRERISFVDFERGSVIDPIYLVAARAGVSVTRDYNGTWQAHA